MQNISWHNNVQVWEWPNIKDGNLKFDNQICIYVIFLALIGGYKQQFSVSACVCDCEWYTHHFYWWEYAIYAFSKHSVSFIPREKAQMQRSILLYTLRLICWLQVYSRFVLCCVLLRLHYDWFYLNLSNVSNHMELWWSPCQNKNFF